MLSHRWRPLWISVLAVVVIWGISLAGYKIAKNSRMTAEKVRAYVGAVDLAKLSGAERARALERLTEMLNRMSAEERRKARMERIAWPWFEALTEEEKAAFIDATMPSGFKQMLTAFEELPAEKRHKAVDDALRRLKESEDKTQAGGALMNPAGTNRPPLLSDDLQAKVRTIGLKTFYSQSSAQTKAELAPVLEELQRAMETGAAFRDRRR